MRTIKLCANGIQTVSKNKRISIIHINDNKYLLQIRHLFDPILGPVKFTDYVKNEKNYQVSEFPMSLDTLEDITVAFQTLKDIQDRGEVMRNIEGTLNDLMNGETTKDEFLSVVYKSLGTLLSAKEK